MNRLTRWLDARRHPGEYPVQRSRRRFLEELRARERPIETTPRAERIHPECRTNHLPWEACPVAPPRIAGVRIER